MPSYSHHPHPSVSSIPPTSLHLSSEVTISQLYYLNVQPPANSHYHRITPNITYSPVIYPKSSRAKPQTDEKKPPDSLHSPIPTIPTPGSTLQNLNPPPRRDGIIFSLTCECLYAIHARYWVDLLGWDRC